AALFSVPRLPKRSRYDLRTARPSPADRGDPDQRDRLRGWTLRRAVGRRGDRAIGMYVKFDRRVDPDAFAVSQATAQGDAARPARAASLLARFARRTGNATWRQRPAVASVATDVKHRRQGNSVRGIFDDPIEG